MRILEKMLQYKELDLPALVHGAQKLTWRELWEQSDRLAAWIQSICGEDKTPIVIYGHKEVYMPMAFLACVKSGRAYVPVDTSVPRDRVERIIDAVAPRLILTTQALEPYASYPIVNISEQPVCGEFPPITPEDYVKEDDVYYIIFTSGSTGNPKGVQITYSNLNHFVEWALTLGEGGERRKIYLNQAPFSFDLSVMDLYMSLASGSCLYMLDKQTQQSYRFLFDALRESGAQVWVSTPSFADMCLADASFCESLLPELELFLFCGETLTNKTADNLRRRFPKAQVYNTYGPTESTVAVTEVLVSDEVLNAYNPLPVGRPKPGTVVQIVCDGRQAAPGEKGEIHILGNTVSAGYFKNAENNARAFYETELDGKTVRAYRTGDSGYLLDGQLFYCGRIDLQIKLHGYRMELEDVEKNLMKVAGVEKAVVIPVWEDGKVKYLKGFCIYHGDKENERRAQMRIKTEMQQFVPDYMVPKKIVFVDAIPMTGNGKANRKLLEEMG